LVFDQRQPGSARRVGGFRADKVLTFLVIDDDVAGTQLVLIVVRAADRDLARMVETVTLGGVGRADAADLAIDQRLAEDRDQARKRTHPAQALGADRGRAPALRLGPGESADDGRNYRGQYVLCR